MSLHKLNKFFMLGVLAEHEDEYPYLGYGNESVTILRNTDSVIFYVRGLSSSPFKFFNQYELDEPLFIGFLDKSFRNLGGENYFGPDFKYLDPDRKVERLKQRLQNKILVFNPVINYEETRNKYHQNLDIVAIEPWRGIEGYSEISEIERLKFNPILSPIDDKEDFERKLDAGEEIYFSGLDLREIDPFDIVLCEDTLYFNLAQGWQIIDANKCLQRRPEQIVKMKVPRHFYNNVVYKYDDYLCFISENYYNELSASSEFADLAGWLDESDQGAAEATEQRPTPPTSNFENEFLNYLYYNARQKGLHYIEEDLSNLHISIKTSPLTIISGMSGTGKTRMAQLYAETLGLSHRDEFIIIPVSPSYTEPGDILGYLNTMSGEFTTSETGLVEILLKAEENTDQLYMVIFDEMNLSQVEHWFAPFISIMELDEKDRILQLYNQENTCTNNYPPYIQIRNNVIFVGTVNIDETTKDFSDRLLDRANVITPTKLDFMAVKERMGNYTEEDNIDFAVQTGDMRKFVDWRREPNDPIQVMTDEELQLLDQLHQVMNRVDSQKGVSFRMVKNIAAYLESRPRDDEGKYLISRADAIDIQLKQRILTKLKGHQQQYGTLIGTLDSNDDSETIYNSEVYEILTSELGQKVSSFTRSLEELKRKAKEMYFNGYAT